MTPTPVSLKGRALRLLSQRDHTRAELERKLAALEEEPGDLARVLDELERKGFIQEGRVVESHLNRRAAKLGASRLRQELLNKGVSPEAVQDALRTLGGTEEERARAVWAHKFGQAPATANDRARHMRFLMSRGFSAAIVQRVLQSAQQAAKADTHPQGD